MKNTATEKQNKTTILCLLINRLGIEMEWLMRWSNVCLTGDQGEQKNNIQRKKWLKNFLELRDTNARTIMNPQWDDSTNWYIHLIGFYSAIKMRKLYLTV